MLKLGIKLVNMRIQFIKDIAIRYKDELLDLAEVTRLQQDIGQATPSPTPCLRDDEKNYKILIKSPSGDSFNFMLSDQQVENIAEIIQGDIYEALAELCNFTYHIKDEKEERGERVKLDTSLNGRIT